MYIRRYATVEGEFLLQKQNSHVNLSNFAVREVYLMTLWKYLQYIKFDSNACLLLRHMFW